MTIYDKNFQETNLFGDPYPEFVEFISRWPYRGKALDLGCGQGRDALFLVSAGFQVTAIDISSVGVSQMLEEAEKRGLEINGISADFYTLPLEQNYELILFDSIFHFEKRAREKELQLLAIAAAHLNPNGLLCIFVHKSIKKEGIIRDFFKINYPNWRVIVDRYIEYIYEEKSSNFVSKIQFRMFFVQNTGSAI